MLVDEAFVNERTGCARVILGPRKCKAQASLDQAFGCNSLTSNSPLLVRKGLIFKNT